MFTHRRYSSILSLLAIPVFLFLAPISIRSQDLSTQEIVAKCMPAVVCIQEFDRTGERIGHGSGFFIAPGRILTAAHVVRGAYSLIVESEERDSKNSDFYQRKGIIILKVDNDSDLAVLGVASVDRPSLELEKDDSSLRIGQSVVEFGNPAQCKVVVSTGIIRGLDRSRPDRSHCFCGRRAWVKRGAHMQWKGKRHRRLARERGRSPSLWSCHLHPNDQQIPQNSRSSQRVARRRLKRPR